MLSFPVASFLHFLLEAMAFFVGFRYFVYLRKRQPDPLNKDNRLWIMVGAAFGAFLGSRLLGALESPTLFWQGGGAQGLLYYWQSKTIVGGLLGGLWSVEIVKKILGEQQRSGDLFVYPLILAMIIGRIGCFLMGVHEPTFGLVTHLPWGLDLGDGLSRHPTALYEILFLLVLWGVLGRQKNWLNGRLFMVFMIAYLAYRLLVGWIQPGERVALDLTSIQWACVVGLIYYVWEWQQLTKQQNHGREKD